MNFSDIKRHFLPLCGIILVAAPAFSAQTAPTLGIGDPAPQLQVKWIKGTPIAKFEPGQTYVVEFWATWCGPCRLAMPHLSDLARKFAGKVTVIGVDVWEKVPAGKSYEDSRPMVEAFVKDMGDAMAYNVAMDVNGKPMVKNWLEASGQLGIPTSFVVRDGKIAWVGGPENLDKVLEEMGAGTYDMARNARQLKQSAAAKDKTMDALMALGKLVEEAIEKKEYARALAAIDAAEADLGTKHSRGFQRIRFSILLKMDDAKALAYARSLGPDFQSYGLTFAAEIADSDGLSVESYRFAAGIFREAASKPGGVQVLIHHYLASSLAKAGDFPGAVSAETKALEAARTAVAAGTDKGVINPSVVAEYERRLESYKAKAAKVK